MTTAAATLPAPTKVYPPDAVHIDRVFLAAIDDRIKPDTSGIAELAADIKMNGQLNPCTVRKVKSADGWRFEVIAGRRRYAACKAAGLDHVRITTVDADDDTAAAIRLAENVHRLQLNPVEEAFAVLRLAETIPGTREEKVTRVAERMGKSATWVRDRWYLSQLTKKVHPLVASGRLPLAHARELAKVIDPDRQLRLAESHAGSEDGLTPPGGLETLRAEVKRCMRSLAQVPWSLSQKVPGVNAPACVSCQANTANDRLLFEHTPAPQEGERCLDNGNGGVRMADAGPFCLNGGCYLRKAQAANTIIQKQAGKVAKALTKAEAACSPKSVEKLNLVPEGVSPSALARAARQEMGTPGRGAGSAEEAAESARGRQADRAQQRRYGLERKASEHARKVYDEWEEKASAIVNQAVPPNSVRLLALRLLHETAQWQDGSGHWDAKTRAGMKIKTPLARLIDTAANAKTAEDLLALLAANRRSGEPTSIEKVFPRLIAPDVAAYVAKALAITLPPQPDAEKVEADKLAELLAEAEQPAAEAPAAKMKGGGK